MKKEGHFIEETLRALCPFDYDAFGIMAQLHLVFVGKIPSGVDNDRRTKMFVQSLHFFQHFKSGDAFDVNDGYGDSMSTIAGVVFPDNTTTVPGDGTNLVEPDFVNLATTAPAPDRYSFVFDGTRQSLDHVLVNAPLVSARSPGASSTRASTPTSPRPTGASTARPTRPASPTTTRSSAYFSLATFPVELISFEIE